MEPMTISINRAVEGLSLLGISLLLLSCGRDLGTEPRGDELSQSASLGVDGRGRGDRSKYDVKYLVSDVTGFGATHIDPNLVNGWGVAITSAGTLWVSSTESGKGLNYDGMGEQAHAPITIPARTASSGGEPTGVIINTTDDFRISRETRSRLLFAGEDGVIAAWSGGSSAVRVATSVSDEAVYKGLAIASVGRKNFIYATNFRESQIDIYDAEFRHAKDAHFARKPFVDRGSPRIPSDYGPFGIANIGGKLYVTYAKHRPPDNDDDLAGPGLGFVSVFNPDGSFVRRLASNGTLNAPWGVVASGAGFGVFSNSLIISNFGDGRINAFSPGGEFLGQLTEKKGKPIVIDGLWGVIFANPELTRALDPNFLYFAAGPDEESHGTFGYVRLAK
jgi:uncharacterized protein (TIGR03118 family)